MLCTVSNVFVIIRTISSRRTKLAVCSFGLGASEDGDEQKTPRGDRPPIQSFGSIGHTTLLEKSMQDQQVSQWRRMADYRYMTK